jgi:hypothetical protein
MIIGAGCGALLCMLAGLVTVTTHPILTRRDARQ